MLSGFDAGSVPLAGRGKTALVVDASSAMFRPMEGGLPHIRAARVAASRFARSVASDDLLDVWIVGGDARRECGTPAVPLVGARDEVVRQLDRLRARGKGSSGDALLALAAEDEPPSRVVLVTSLFDECGDSLCSAAEALAARGTRLDLVVVGNFVAPACLSTDALASAASTSSPVPWTTGSPTKFHVVSGGDDPAIEMCGDVNGLPVEVRSGAAEIVVELTPPLRVTHEFVDGKRWKLEVIDFPTLDPPERQWRWREVAKPAAVDPATPAAALAPPSDFERATDTDR